MIATGRFSEFVLEIIRMYSEEEEEKIIWEMWLHKCIDKSYSDFKNSLGMRAEKAAPTHDEQVKTVRHSFDMLNGFNPMGAGEDGAIQAAGDNSG